MDCFVQAVVKVGSTTEAKQLSQTVHHLHVQNELLHHKNNALKEALTAYKRHKGKGKTLDLQQRKEFCSNAVM
jgi:peroxiredoxin